MIKGKGVKMQKYLITNNDLFIVLTYLHKRCLVYFYCYIIYIYIYIYIHTHAQEYIYPKWLIDFFSFLD